LECRKKPVSIFGWSPVWMDQEGLGHRLYHFHTFPSFLFFSSKLSLSTPPTLSSLSFPSFYPSGIRSTSLTTPPSRCVTRHYPSKLTQATPSSWCHASVFHVQFLGFSSSFAWFCIILIVSFINRLFFIFPSSSSSHRWRHAL